MYVHTCRRCGETSLGEKADLPTIECAGETVALCRLCFDAFRDWFYGPAALEPELEGEQAANR